MYVIVPAERALARIHQLHAEAASARAVALARARIPATPRGPVAGDRPAPGSIGVTVITDALGVAGEL